MVNTKPPPGPPWPKQIAVRLKEPEAKMLKLMADAMGVSAGVLARSIIEHVLWDDQAAGGGTIANPDAPPATTIIFPSSNEGAKSYVPGAGEA